MFYCTSITEIKMEFDLTIISRPANILSEVVRQLASKLTIKMYLLIKLLAYSFEQLNLICNICSNIKTLFNKSITAMT